MDASVRASRRTRPITAEFEGIMDDLKSRPPPHGKPPTEVMIHAHTFRADWPRPMYAEGQGFPDPKWQAGVKKFKKMFALSTGPPDVNSTTNFGEASGWLGKDMPAAQGLQALVTNGAGSKSWFTNLGDEIALTGPENDYRGADPSTGAGFPLQVNQSALNKIFEQWLKQQQILPAAAGCDPYAGCIYNTSIMMASEGQAHAFYYSNLFRYDYELHNASKAFGVLAHVPYHNVTAELLAFQKKTGQLLGGHTTANFPPSAMCYDERYNQTRDNSYLPKTNMWIGGYRENTFTLPFTEDYIFQIAAGSQQMYDLVIDVERAAIRPLPSSDELSAMASPMEVAAAPLRKLPSTATVPGRPIMQYVMLHNPGNTVRSERRRFYASIAHGAKWIDYFVLQTFATGPGDFTDSHHGMYPAVQTQLNEYGMFDDIVARGVPQAQGAKASLVFSATEDMYWDAFGTPGAAKRALFVTIRHAQIALDVICEDDIESGLVNEYALVFLSAGHLREASATALVKWVAAGGTLFGSVSLGMLNEFNQTNTELASLYGIEEPFGIIGSHQAGPGTGEISFVKQDLQYAETLDTVTVAAAATSADGDTPLLALGEKAVLKLAAKPSATVFARFKDHSPALYRKPHGKGAAIVAAFHLGFAYFRPALPKRPVARGSTDETFNHFVPTAFGVAARSLIETTTSHIAALQPVLATPERRLDIMVIAAAGRGTVITVVNWSDSVDIKGLELVLQFECTFSKATLASGGAVKASKAADGKTKLTFDLAVADAVILRV